MKGRRHATGKAIAAAAVMVVLFAVVMRLVSWGSAAVTAHLQRIGEGRILGRVLSPSPVRTPWGVVHVQLDALRNNDVPLPNTGLATFYNFMEPEVRAGLGSFADYAEAMTNSIYADLFADSEVRFGPMRIQGDQAQQSITVTTPEGQRARYVFTLAIQKDGPYAGCWMNRNIVRYPQYQPEVAVQARPRQAAGDESRPTQ